MYFVFSINVILFWIASGYFFKPGSPWRFKKEARAILLPYAITALLAVVITGVVIVALDGGYRAALGGAWDVLKAALYGSGSKMANSVLPVGAIGGIWFLLALFWGKLFLFLAHKTKYPSAIMVAAFLLGWFSSQYLFLPFSIQPGLCAAFFLHVGYLCRAHGLFEDKRIPIPIWIMMPIIWVLVVWWSKGIYPVSCTYPHGPIDAIGVICGCFCVVIIAKFIDRHSQQLSRFLQFVGQNTLVLFSMHVLVIDRVPIELLANSLRDLTGIPVLVAFFVLQLALPIIMSALIYILPTALSSIFFPQKRKRLESHR
jgi:hypothetical protein